MYDDLKYFTWANYFKICVNKINVHTTWSWLCNFGYSNIFVTDKNLFFIWMKYKIRSLCLFNEQMPKNNAPMSTTTQNLRWEASSTIAFIWCFVQFIFFPFSLEIFFFSYFSRNSDKKEKEFILFACFLSFFSPYQKRFFLFSVLYFDMKEKIRKSCMKWEQKYAEKWGKKKR